MLLLFLLIFVPFIGAQYLEGVTVKPAVPKMKDLCLDDFMQVIMEGNEFI